MPSRPSRAPRPHAVRAVVAVLVAAATAHALAAFLTLAAWAGHPLVLVPAEAWPRLVVPVAVIPASAPWQLAVAALASLAAGASARAAHRVARLSPRADRPAQGAAWLSLLNPPVGTLLGLVALAHLAAPDLRRALLAPYADE